MSKLKKSCVGKIGYCDNKVLGINKSGGHYVYIRDIKGTNCSVNVITSLEDKDKQFNYKRLNQVKKGNIYPLPLQDTDFSRWSGVGKNSIQNVKLSDIQDIDRKKIKHRHKFFIGKYMR